jgi:CRP-like cAMP-binding protein
VVTIFAVEDSPDAVCAMLNQVAAGLPQLRVGAAPTSRPNGALEYKTLIPLRTAADDIAARANFLRWIWYASRRAGLHLDEADDDFETPERLAEALLTVGPTLRLNRAEQQEFLAHARTIRYGTDEYIHRAGQVPKHMMVIVRGRVQLAVAGADGALLDVRIVEDGEFLGQTALTREPTVTTAYALEEVTVLQIERNHIEDLVRRKPLLLQDIARTIDERRSHARRALAAADN